MRNLRYLSVSMNLEVHKMHLDSGSDDANITAGLFDLKLVLVCQRIRKSFGRRSLGQEVNFTPRSVTVLRWPWLCHDHGGGYL